MIIRAQLFHTETVLLGELIPGDMVILDTTKRTPQLTLVLSITKVVDREFHALHTIQLWTAGCGVMTWHVAGAFKSSVLRVAQGTSA
jgi:hypothetical protein